MIDGVVLLNPIMPFVSYLIHEFLRLLSNQHDQYLPSFQCYNVMEIFFFLCEINIVVNITLPKMPSVTNAIQKYIITISSNYIVNNKI